MPLKKLIVFLLIISLGENILAQKKTADLGLFLGGSTSLCDYSKTNFFQSIHPDFGIFYRYNLNTRFSLRINALYGNVGAKGELDTQDPITFKKKVLDFDGIIEVNYLDFMMGVEKMRFSPFVFTGIGVTYYPGINGAIITPNIPIGTGIKYAVGKHLALGAEASLHKLMNDGLDDLDNPYQSEGLTKVSDIFHNNDWISYFGLTLTYKFFTGKTPCPAYNTIN